MNSQGFGIGKDVCYTLNAVDVHAVLDTTDSPPIARHTQLIAETEQ